MPRSYPEFAGSPPRKCGSAPRCARFPPVKRTVATLASIVVLMLVFAPAALASSGAGLAGPVTDKTITFFCFGVIAFFAAVVIVLSLIQNRLEKRKEQRRSDLARFN
jgi:putative copper export protein